MKMHPCSALSLHRWQYLSIDSRDQNMKVGAANASTQALNVLTRFGAP